MDIASATATSAHRPPNEIAARRAAEQFEAMAIAQFLAPLFSSVDAPSIVGGGSAGEDAFRSLLQQEYAKAVAARGGFGIAAEVQRALIELQAEKAAAGGAI